MATPNPYLNLKIETDKTRLTVTRIDDNQLLIETEDPRDEQYYQSITVDARTFIDALRAITGITP